MSDTVNVPNTNIPIATCSTAGYSMCTSCATVSASYPKFNPTGSIDKSKTYLVTVSSSKSVKEVDEYMEYLENEGIKAVIVPEGFQFYEAKHVEELKAAINIWLKDQ